MNKIDFSQAGGKPITQDDFNFLQVGYFEAVNALLSVLPNINNGYLRSYILTGCNLYLDLGTNTYWIAPGYVALNNYINGYEIFYVPSQNIGISTLIGHSLSWKISDLSVFPDPDVFKNLVSRNTHRRRTAYISLAGGNAPYDDTATFLTQLIAQLNLSAFTWNVVGSGGGQPAFQGTWGALTGNVVRFTKSLSGIVTIQGIAVPAAGGGSSDIIFTLPVGSRPGQSLPYSIWKDDGSGNLVPEYAVVYSNGNVAVKDAQPTYQYTLNLPSFPAEA